MKDLKKARGSKVTEKKKEDGEERGELVRMLISAGQCIFADYRHSAELQY